MSTGITPLDPEQVAAQEKQTAKEGYVHRDLVALDMLGNVLTGGNPDETISSRLARDAEQNKVVGEIGSKLLDLVQKNHGAKAIAGDLERAQVIENIESSDPAIQK